MKFLKYNLSLERGNTMIKVERVIKRFGDNVALNQISFSINEGEIFWIPRSIWFRENNNDQYSDRTATG